MVVEPRTTANTRTTAATDAPAASVAPRSSRRIRRMIAARISATAPRATAIPIPRMNHGTRR
jgi:hypothetical protein